MTEKSSINIQPVKTGSEVHNLRQKDFDYVRKDLQHLNENWVGQHITDCRKQIRTRYEQATGQQMQAKATPIREGVFRIRKDHSLEDCKAMAEQLQQRFGIRTIQIHLHKDEGHWDEHNKWNPNLHAHIIFDWTDPKTGKSIKLNRKDMSEMQSLVADSLGMVRGQSSDKKHLSALQHKIAQEKAKLERIEALSDTISLEAESIVHKWFLGVDRKKTVKNVEALLLKFSKAEQDLQLAQAQAKAEKELRANVQLQADKSVKFIAQERNILAGMLKEIQETKKMPERVVKYLASLAKGDKGQSM